MPGFTYYLPGTAMQDVVQGPATGGKINAELLAAFGLDHLHDIRVAGIDAVVSEVRKDGPDGGAGIVLHVRSNAERLNPQLDETWSLKYSPAKQVWSQAIAGRFWIGYDREHLPTPEDLQRKAVIDGHAIADADEMTWLIPIARSPRKEFGTLPVSVAFAADGGIVQALDPRFEYLWKIACEIFDKIQAGEEIEDVVLLDRTIQILGCNYRLGRSEQRVLHDAGRRVCDQEFFTKVIIVLVDFSIVQAVTEEKKTETSSDQLPDSSNTLPGQEDSGQITAPASAS